MNDDRSRPRVLLCATTTGYQTRMFDDAAGRLGVDLVLGTDRCDQLDDPWRDRAIAVRFHDEAASWRAIHDALPDGLDGVLAVGDRPVVLAAIAAERFGVPWHGVEGARASRDKRLFRAALAQAGLPAPRHVVIRRDAGPPAIDHVGFPCVVKPLVLSGSRGVIRADDPASLAAAMARVAGLLDAPDVRALRDPAADLLLVESFVPGFEVALEGVLDRGRLHVLALFDKPDPLDGPFFEETIYVTPTARADAAEMSVVAAVTRAAAAAGLWQGPIHAECRVHGSEVVVLEIAARPIGGRCAAAIRLEGPDGAVVSLEEILLRHVLGEDLRGWRRVPGAAGVMMVPIPRSGVLRRVDGVDAAAAVAGVTEVAITAKADQRLLALPEGAAYLGFIFASAAEPAAVEQALRDAHARLAVTIDPLIEVRASA